VWDQMQRQGWERASYHLNGSAASTGGEPPH
jgi:hypothetical protein